MAKIFHYTTLETLELMLSNKTIRLNSLMKMDDLLEGSSVDFGSMAKYYYISSWTYDKEENIPLWLMYTKELKGVRIEADENFLQIEKDKNGAIKNVTDSNLIVFPVNYDNSMASFLVPVVYSDTLKECIDNRGLFNENIYDIGRIKPLAWKFQNEVRFRVYGISKKNLVGHGSTLFERFVNSMYNWSENDITIVDIKFPIQNLKNANFVLGPGASDGDLTRVREIVEKHIPHYCGDIQKSALQIRFIKK